MKSDRSPVALAAMSLLRSERLSPLGRVEFFRLQARWGLYALRRGDFETGMRRLESLGLIEIEKVRGRPYVILTRTGYTRIYSILRFLESMLTWPRRIQQLIWRLRRRSGSGQARRRRTDRGAVARRSTTDDE